MKVGLLLAASVAVAAAQSPIPGNFPTPDRPLTPPLPDSRDHKAPAPHAENPPTPAHADVPDPRVTAILPRIKDAAELFDASAQQYMCRETLRQRVIHPGAIRKARRGEGITGATLRYDTRQIESWFAFTTYGKSPAVHEMRSVINVDKERLLKDEQARKLMRDAILARDDKEKGDISGKFAEEALNGVATDLGQMILLFDSRNQKKYEFDFEREEPIGNVRTLVIRYAQVSGKESVHINENGKELKETIRGWLWASLPEGVPLRITLITARKSGKQETRDEAEVDYARIADGALLPTAVLHRRYEDDILAAEDDFQYSGWQSLK